jgi:hypothetical protein
MTDNVTGSCESKYILIYNLTMTDNVHFKAHIPVVQFNCEHSVLTVKQN